MKRSILENIKGSSDLWQNEGLLHSSSLSWTVVFHSTFAPMKAGREKDIILIHIPPFLVLCSNSYSRILDRCSPLFS